MRIQSILSILVGMVLCAFGALMGLGSFINMVEPEKSHQVVTYGLVLFFLGILPFALGLAAIVYGWRSNSRRHFESRERELLGLALKHGGSITVPQATMAMKLTSQEVKSLLETSATPAASPISPFPTMARSNIAFLERPRTPKFRPEMAAGLPLSFWERQLASRLFFMGQQAVVDEVMQRGWNPFLLTSANHRPGPGFQFRRFS